MLSERPVGSLALRRRRNFSVDVTESAGLLQVEGIPSVAYPNMQSCIARLSCCEATVEKRYNPTPESHCGAAASRPQGPRRIAGRQPSALTARAGRVRQCRRGRQRQKDRGEQPFPPATDTPHCQRTRWAGRVKLDSRGGIASSDEAKDTSGHIQRLCFPSSPLPPRASLRGVAPRLHTQLVIEGKRSCRDCGR